MAGVARVPWAVAVMDLLPLAQVCDELRHRAGGNSPEPQSWGQHWGSAERGTGNRWERRFLRMLQVSEFPAQSHTWGGRAALSWSLRGDARTEPEQRLGIPGEQSEHKKRFPAPLGV